MDTTKTTERRVRRYHIDERMFFVLSQDGHTTRVMRGIPAGAKLLGAYFDYARGVFAIMVEHPSFELVQINEEAPMFNIVFEDV